MEPVYSSHSQRKARSCLPHLFWLSHVKDLDLQTVKLSSKCSRSCSVLSWQEKLSSSQSSWDGTRQCSREQSSELTPLVRREGPNTRQGSFHLSFGGRMTQRQWHQPWPHSPRGETADREQGFGFCPSPCFISSGTLSWSCCCFPHIFFICLFFSVFLFLSFSFYSFLMFNLFFLFTPFCNPFASS